MVSKLLYIESEDSWTADIAHSLSNFEGISRIIYQRVFPLPAGLRQIPYSAGHDSRRNQVFCHAASIRGWFARPYKNERKFPPNSQEKCL